MIKPRIIRSVLTAAVVVLTAASGTAAYRAAAPALSPAANTNLMAGWDGNGMGNNTDKPNDFGWTCSDNSKEWNTVQTGYDNTKGYYRDNLEIKGATAQRTLMHGGTTAAYSYPVASLQAGKIYKFLCDFSNMNNSNVATIFCIASEQFGEGTVCGRVQKNAPKWDNTSTAEFLFEVPSDGTYYLSWQTTVGDKERAIAWGFSVTEATNAHRVTFTTGTGASAVHDQLHEGDNYKVTQPQTPTKTGYDFMGWYTDAACTTAYDFSTQQTSDLTLYAHFTQAAKNHLAGWDGNGRGSANDKPSDFGWVCSDDKLEWSPASNTDNYKNFYRDNLQVKGVETRVLTHNENNAVFSYPVKDLEANKFYKFHCYNTNMNHSVSTTMGINTKRDGTGTSYGSQTRLASKWSAYTTSEFLFKTPATVPSEVYITWQTPIANERNLAWDFSIKEVTGVNTVTWHTNGGTPMADQYYEGDYTLSVPDEPTKEGCDFAGWYTNESLTTAYDFTSTQTDDVDLYARFLSTDYSGPLENLTVTTNTTLPLVAATAVTVANGVELHLTDAHALRAGSTIDLAGENATLYLDQTYGEEFATLIAPHLTIAGRAFDADKDRVALYRNGCLVMPGELTHTPVTAYTEENLSGTSLECKQDVFYRLNAEQYKDTYDNKIRSLHIRKGYMACLANNPDGTGFSKVFIANDGDLDVNTLPAALQWCSFIRVSRWDWPGKRGKANQPASLTHASWYYNWSAGKNPASIVTEFVPIRQNLGWPGWAEINNLKNVSHVLGLNEPDHRDQSNATVEEAIEQWYHMAESGLRIGSPACDALNKGWLKNFIALANELNYRVDFTAAHMYWSGQSGSSIVSSINAQSNATDGRPVWITEWNNGANWTDENWPDQTGKRRDADFNVTLDAEGNPKTTTRPHTQANSAKQVAWLKDVLPALDRCDKLERHAFYDWVQDARAIVLDDKLTPAGKYFAAYNSEPAYKASAAYDHQWHIAPPYVVASTEASDNFKKAHVRFYDHNGETGTNYIVERQTDGGAWEVIKTLAAGIDYQPGDKAVSVVEELTCTTTQSYRIKATAIADLGGDESAYSRTATITRDALTTAATPAATAVCATKAQVTWTKPTGARAYKLERAVVTNNVCGEYETLGSALTETEYNDEELTPATTYRYQLTTLSSAANDLSATADATLPALQTPDTPHNLKASNGDNCIALTWDFAYDAKYNVLRSATAEGTYQKIAQAVEGTRYADETVSNGQMYYYKVEAYNSAGTSAQTAAVSGTAVAGQRAHIAMDENTGTVAFDEWGGYNGRLENGAKWVAGQTDQDANDHAVLSAKATKAYVRVGDDITCGLTDFTIATWVRFQGGGWGRLFDFGTATNNFMMVKVDAKGIRYKITAPEHGSVDHTFVHPNVNNSEKWTHIVLTQSGETLSCYVNGELVEAIENATTTPGDMGPTNCNYLARSQYSQDAYPDFAYGDLRIYNRALSESAVQKLFQGTTTLSAPQAATITAEANECPTGAQLSWPLITGATYKLQRALVNNGQCGEYEDLELGSDLTVGKYEDEGLTPATTYRYRLTTLNPDYNHLETTADVTLPALRRLDTPSQLSASNDQTAITLSWTCDYEAKFNVLRSNTAEGTFEPIATDVAGKTYVDQTAQKGQTYYYKVEAYTCAGTSLPSTAAQGSIASTSLAPTPAATAPAQSRIYDLTGRRFTHATQPGIYIIDGRKVVVK